MRNPLQTFENIIEPAFDAPSVTIPTPSQIGSRIEAAIGRTLDQLGIDASQLASLSDEVSAALAALLDSVTALQQKKNEVDARHSYVEAHVLNQPLRVMGSAAGMAALVSLEQGLISADGAVRSAFQSLNKLIDLFPSDRDSTLTRLNQIDPRFSGWLNEP